MTINSVVFIESLADDEWHTGTWLQEDLASKFDVERVYHKLHTVRSKDDLNEVMLELRGRVRRGLRPILHIDAHGEDAGMRILPSKQLVSWSELVRHLREINRASLNNLVVVLSMCTGFRAILSMDVHDVAPFYQLIGTQHKVRNSAILTAFPAFYRTLLETQDLTVAANAIRGLGFKSCLAERVLIMAFIEYVLVQCRGRGRQRRLERLVSQVRAKQPSRSAADIRKELRARLTPTSEHLERYKRKFLMSHHPENHGRFTIAIDECLALVHDVDPDTIAAYRLRFLDAI